MRLAGDNSLHTALCESLNSRQLFDQPFLAGRRLLRPRHHLQNQRLSTASHVTREPA